MRQSNARRPRANSKTRYGSLSSFYIADARRARSRERDIGLWWRDDVGGPLHRAAWVADTGELYLVRLGAQSAGGGEVEVLATVSDRDRLERALVGWRERCGEQRSLAWLRTRAAGLDGRRASGSRRVASWTPEGRVTTGRGSMRSTMSSLTSELSRKPAGHLFDPA
jgi:hypothetical protein